MSTASARGGGRAPGEERAAPPTDGERRPVPGHRGPSRRAARWPAGSPPAACPRGLGGRQEGRRAARLSPPLPPLPSPLRASRHLGGGEEGAERRDGREGCTHRRPSPQPASRGLRFARRHLSPSKGLLGMAGREVGFVGGVGLGGKAYSLLEILSSLKR